MIEDIEDYINYVYIEKKLSCNTKDAYLSDLKEFSSYLDDKKLLNPFTSIRVALQDSPTKSTFFIQAPFVYFACFGFWLT